MPKHYTRDELSDLRKQGVQVPYVMEKPKPKDQSVQTLEGIGNIISNHLQIQDKKDVLVRQEISEILRTLVEIIKTSDAKEIKIDLKDLRPRKWRHAVTYNSKNMVSEIVSEAI